MPRDGLLAAGEPGVQLTWMDAKVGDWVVTPRIGKPVEINALWFNALAILERLARERKDSGRARSLKGLLRRRAASFRSASGRRTRGSSSMSSTRRMAGRREL